MKLFEGSATTDWEEMETKLVLIVGEGRVKLMRPMDPTAINNHHDLFVGVATGRHHLMDILAQFLSTKMEDDCG